MSTMLKKLARYNISSALFEKMHAHPSINAVVCCHILEIMMCVCLLKTVAENWKEKSKDCINQAESKLQQKVYNIL